MTPEPYDNERHTGWDNSELAGYWPTEPRTEPGGRFEHHDDQADEVENLELRELGCEYCLGCFIPAGTHSILGPVYLACTRCTDLCRCCDGRGLFPADTTCPHCLDEALRVLGFTAGFCHTCAGVLAVHPTSAVTP